MLQKTNDGITTDHIKFENGDEYIGDLYEGQAIKNGRFLEKNGNIYEGNWIKNLRQGRGKQIWIGNDGKLN